MAMVFRVRLTALTPGTPVIVDTVTSVPSCFIESWSLIADSEVAGTVSSRLVSCANVVKLIVPPASRSALLTTTFTAPRNPSSSGASRSKLFQLSVTLSLLYPSSGRSCWMSAALLPML